MVERKILISVLLIALIVPVGVYTVGLFSVPLDESDLAWIEEKGVRLSLNFSEQTLHTGEILKYTVKLKNVDSPSSLYLYQSAGYLWIQIHDQNGSIIKSKTGRYAWGPPGQPEETFIHGDIWQSDDSWDLQLPSGNYTLYVKASYGIIEQESETIEISVPIKIIES